MYIDFEITCGKFDSKQLGWNNQQLRLYDIKIDDLKEVLSKQGLIILVKSELEAEILENQAELEKTISFLGGLL